MTWRSIKDDPPPMDEIILLYRPGAVSWMVVAPGKWDAQSFNKKPNPFWDCWLKIGGAYESRKWPPTHWMPLPEPPDA
jgi:hypothetical protein